MFTVRGSDSAGWGQWHSVSEGSTTPGAPVTAVNAGDGLFQLFLSDPGGGVFTVRGSDSAGWGQWHSVSEGSTTPGAPVTAVNAGDGFLQLFLSDPGGGVFTVRGSDSAGWGQWHSVSEGATTPGAPIAAVADHEGLIVVVVADPHGGVYATRGSESAGWGQWQSVSQGATTPGAPIGIAPDGTGSYQLLLSDPGGGVYTAHGSVGLGWGEWRSVSQGATTPGAPVSVVASGNGLFQLFLADPGGGVFTARGSEQAGWGQWRSVSQGATTPGAPITALPAGGAFSTVFLADPKGGVFTSTNRVRPAAPVNLYVTRVGNDFIDLAWIDESDNEDGFHITYKGSRQGEPHDEGTKSVAANSTSASLSGLLSGYEYLIAVKAHNAVGDSLSSNAVNATTTDTPHEVTVTMVRLHIDGPTQYQGGYPAFGSVQPGRVLNIAVPASTEIVAVRFLNAGGELVDVAQDTIASPAKMQKIFGGTGQPAYATGQPVLLQALIAQKDAKLLEQVQVMLSVVDD